MAHPFTKQDFTIGAIYRLGASRRLARSVIETLLVERARLKAATARQLAGHWFTTCAYRKRDAA
jgi:hypothetical protein